MMGKLPRYVIVTGPFFTKNDNGTHSAHARIKIKWWGWPIVLLRGLKNRVRKGGEDK